MIHGAHVIVYSKDAEADRVFFRDVLKYPFADAGHGWLIFALPPAEVAVHPSDENDVHELYLMCRRRQGAHRGDDGEERRMLGGARGALGVDHEGHPSGRREARDLPAEARLAAREGAVTPRAAQRGRVIARAARRPDSIAASAQPAFKLVFVQSPAR